MSPFDVSARLRPSTASVTRTADNWRLVNRRTQGCVAFSSVLTPMVFSDAGKPGNGSCHCVPVRKSIDTLEKLSVPSSLATGVPFK
ncbi:Uncharacterised protein [Achromobacter xylosoxidans]|nr:Uncharacterised protein [Achromobacter xylosoxidans]